MFCLSVLIFLFGHPLLFPLAVILSSFVKKILSPHLQSRCFLGEGDTPNLLEMDR